MRQYTILEIAQKTNLEINEILSLITNGTLLAPGIIKDLIRTGIQMFELPLLASDKSVHNRLCRNESFEKVINSLIHIKENQGRVVVVFVATRWNIHYFEETLKLCLAIGLDGLMFNRFNPGGEGLNHIDELLPSLAEVKEALIIAEEFAKNYGFSVTCGIAFQPCLIDLTLYPHVGFLSLLL